MKLISSSLIEYATKQIALFGSGARGDENAGKDLDILVSFPGNGKSPSSLLELLSLEKTLESQLGFPIEIVNEKV